jgi:biopolymer transport protein ExbB
MVGLTTKIAAHSKSPVARLIEKGISRIGKPLEDQYHENAGKLEIYKLEKNVSMWLPFQEQDDWF